MYSKGHKMYPGSEKGWIKPGHPLYSQWKGKKFTDKHRENISKSHLGQKAWNKGKVGLYKTSEETREKLRSGNNSGWFQKGHLVPFDWYSHFWKGGITPVNMQIRSSVEYKDWRTAVFERDNYTCQECGKHGGRLNVNHIIHFSFIMKHERIKSFEDALKCELLWDINNGETLCESCHKTLRRYRINYPHVLKLDLQKTI